MNISGKFAAIFAIALVAWFVGGSALYKHVSASSNSAHLQDLSQHLAERTEKALDYVVIAGTELLINGHSSCSDAAVAAMGDMVLNTATVSEIFMITAGSACSAFNGKTVALPEADVRQGWSVARNPKFRVGVIHGENSKTLGVSWGFGSDLEVVMAISPDALVFDVLPSELRENGHVDLFVGTGDRLIHMGHDSEADLDHTHSESFSADGARYPVRAEISLDRHVLVAWRTTPPKYLVGGWLVFGGIFAAICGRALLRGYDPEVAALAEALRVREIKPHFQPIINLDDGSVIGCEALARWIKPCGERVSPAKFIPLVEKSGLADQLLEVMIEETARSLGPQVSENPNFYVSFNVTPEQFVKPEFPDQLKALLKRHELCAKQICIEITEREAISAPEKAQLVIEKLSGMGVHIAIDDAGTGHNGLASMHQLTAGSLKIDKFFVDQVHEDPRSRVMIEMFVSVSRQYGMQTIAEGVETQEQALALRAAGVDAVQGYFFSAPVPATKMIDLLKWEFDLKPSEDNQLEAAYESPADAEPADEAARLAALQRYQILDTPEDEAFDRIPRIIQRALGAPMAAIAFVDEDRRWFKAVSGGRRGELPRSISFCNHTIQRDHPTIVADTHLDERFRKNKLVVEAPYIRAYLGVPLMTPDGFRIGSVCCVDKKPREFTREEIELVQDLSSIVMEQLELRQMALYDPLTSVRSRRGFRSDVEMQLALEKRYQREFSLLMLDIDHFKAINDSFGHQVGDEILAGLGQRLIETLRECDLVGRIGGDEFVVALPETNRQEARRCGERIREAVEAKPFETQAGSIEVKVSLGAASVDGGSYQLDALLEQADKVLYCAKENGRNRVCSEIVEAA